MALNIVLSTKNVKREAITKKERIDLQGSENVNDSVLNPDEQLTNIPPIGIYIFSGLIVVIIFVVVRYTGVKKPL